MKNVTNMNVANQLFGPGVRKLPNTGNHHPSRKRLRQPLTSPDSVTREFCQGCGSCFELTTLGLSEAANQAGIQIPEKLEDHFLLTSSCPLDDGTVFHAEFKKIKEDLN